MGQGRGHAPLLWLFDGGGGGGGCGFSGLGVCALALGAVVVDRVFGFGGFGRLEVEDEAVGLGCVLVDAASPEAVEVGGCLRSVADGGAGAADVELERSVLGEDAVGLVFVQPRRVRRRRERGGRVVVVLVVVVVLFAAELCGLFEQEPRVPLVVGDDGEGAARRERAPRESKRRAVEPTSTYSASIEGTPY